jgi:hypothetical protein
VLTDRGAYIAAALTICRAATRHPRPYAKKSDRRIF